MITILEVDDWMALYKDGKLIAQNHSIHWSRILDETDVEYKHRSLALNEAAKEFADSDDPDDFMRFPEELPDGK